MVDGLIEKEKNFESVRGFSYASQLGMSPARLEDYRQHGLTLPKPGQFCQDNGMIAAVLTNGEVAVWVPKEDPKTPREVTREEAINALKLNGFTEGYFAVPKFEK